MLRRAFQLVAFAALLFVAGPTGAAEVVSLPRATGAEATVAKALQAGLDGDFEAYLALVLPELREGNAKKNRIKKSEWRRFRGHAQWYLKERRPITFVVARRQQDANNYVRLYLQDQKHKDRAPVPVRLKKQGKTWYLVTNSL